VLPFQLILLGTALAPVPLLLWPRLYLRVRSWIEPPPVTPAPPTPDLGDEPPAVVNLLVHQDPVTVDAAEATLLELASRGILELWAPDGTGPHTVVRVRQSYPAGLAPYENLVMDRIRQRATGGVVPLTALAFKDRKEAWTFLRGFSRSVADAAAARGLVEPDRRAHLLSAAAPLVVEALWIAVLMLVIPGLAFFTVPVATLTWLAWRWMRPAMWELSPRWQLSPIGRMRAAHWMGVRDWLHGFPTFADLPPAAVAVWDRYLAYGAALDATPSTSATIDLGYDWRKRLWSAYGGQWRRAKVRTKTWAAIRLALLRPGVLVPELVLGFVWSLIGPFLVVVLPFGHELLGLILLLPNPFLLFPVVVLPVAGYLIARRLIDAARPVRVTGVVLHVRYVGQRFFSSIGADPQAVVIDDGTGDRLTEWLLINDDTRLHPGDLVRGRAGRWYRRLKPFEVLPPSGTAGSRAPSADASASRH
jgi:hypothetical protein